ncbi:helix-turn-helix domain-containing protein [Pseudalkalibacillus hwajinpoensis]|uniref:ATP synthase beta subunit C-terminal domain-containing protein n=1 Tax=Guptibacillus hwajinpoensis TaxID=208199 RepID=UPI00325BFB25
MEDLKLDVALLRRRVPNLTTAAKSVGLRPATVSNLCTGKIPIGRAEVRTLSALATLADCRLDDLLIRGERFEMIESGVKLFDLFAPLAKGGTVGLVARPGMGQLVVLAEMFHRMRKQGYTTILLKPEGEHPELNDLFEEVDVVCETADEVYDQAAIHGIKQDILLGADRSNVVSGEIFQLQERLEEEGIQSLTTLLVDLKGEAMDDDFPYGPLETLWQFDSDLAVRHLYPAVNPIYSTSTVLEGAQLDQTHLTLQQKARKLLRRYRELRSLVNVSGFQSLPSTEVQTYKRGERLEAYLSQPFYVAEAFTGQKGEMVRLTELLNDVQRILDGAEDAKEVEELTFIGKLF